MDTSHLLLSCAFGSHITRVYPSIPGYRNVFFSNNPALAENAQDQGWEFRLLDQFPLSDDGLISSIQAKYVKFLQFIPGQRCYEDLTRVTYFDHKFYVEAKHIDWILNNCRSDSDLLIRETPREKLTIADEISDAMKQERYSRNMSGTLDFLDRLQAAKRISPSVRIVNTGLIHYQNLPICRYFAQSVYNACLALNQPECQIIWAALSQTLPVQIQRVQWTDLEPLWRTP